MTDGDPGTDLGRQSVGDMHHGAILDVAALADLDDSDVAPQHSARPDTGLGPDGHIAHDDGFGVHKGRGVDARSFRKVPR